MYFDASVQKVYRFVDGVDGDTLDGVFHDNRNNHATQLVLLNASGGTVSALSSATTARIDFYNGVTESYQLIDLDPDASLVYYAGRFTKRTDLDGRQLNISYKSWTSSEITASPIRQFQINTVTDYAGKSLTFTYGATQVGGMWAVSRIDRNDGQYTTYCICKQRPHNRCEQCWNACNYLVWSRSRSSNGNRDVSDVNLTAGRSLTYHLTNDYMTLSSSGQSSVINQPVGVRRMIVNASNSTEWMMITPSDPSNPNRFVYLGGNYAIRESVYKTGMKYATWSYNQSGGGDLDSGTGMPIFYGVTGTLDPLAIGVASTTTTAQLYTGQIPGNTNETGSQFTYTYNSSGQVTRKTYTADSTYSEFAYNSVGKMTRSRSRTQEVTQYVYDSAGHLITKKEGLKEQSGSDVQTAEYSETNYDYYPSTHANKGLLKTAYSPLYSSSTPTIYRTDYEYDTAGRLTKITESADVSGGARPVSLKGYDSTGNLTSETDPLGRVTTYAYDSLSRKISTTYPDGSTEQTLYGTIGSTTSGKVLKTKDRMGTVTTYSYDSTGALTQTVQAAAIDANILDGMADDTTITDPNLKTVTAYTYLASSTTLPTQVLVNGAKTDFVYDTYNRVIEDQEISKSRGDSIEQKELRQQPTFYDEDPYGRRKYYGYRASDGTLIRTITCTVPEQSYTDSTAVWNATRDLSQCQVHHQRRNSRQ